MAPHRFEMNVVVTLTPRPHCRCRVRVMKLADSCATPLFGLMRRSCVCVCVLAVVTASPSFRPTSSVSGIDDASFAVFIASLTVGAHVDVLDGVNRWCDGVVLDITPDRYVTHQGNRPAL